MSDSSETRPPTGVGMLEHLTGPSRGTVTWLWRATLDLVLSAQGLVVVSEALPGKQHEDLVARLHPVDGTFEIEAPHGRHLWVNGRTVTSKRLNDNDVIELGEIGPISRLRLHSNKKQSRKTVSDMLSDCFAYLRVSRRPLGRRIFRAVCELARRLTRETTILFRTSVIVAILALVALAYQQSRLSVQLEQRIESGVARLDSFAAALSKARTEALTQHDLKMLRQELSGQMTTNAERLAALERRSKASGRVISESLASVAFLQGAYGFRERSSGRMLRHVVDETGRPIMSPLGQPLLSLKGDGAVAERQFTGTGFAVGPDGVFVTNRHVALPWENDANVEGLAAQGLEPVMIKFIAYLPGRPIASAIETVRAAKDADLAVLRLKSKGAKISGLRPAEASPTAGDEVIVMGYPTGLRSMLAQAGDAFIEELQEAENVDFWNVAVRLAEAGHIVPLASRGIVGQARPTAIVYDAETTHGGSGGPVIDINGEIVAVNTAILPEFGGSNLGVPVAKLRALLKEAGII